MEIRFTVEETAERLRVSPRRVHALVRSGQLACIQVTPRVRVFTQEQLDAFEQARTVSALPVIPVLVPKVIDKPGPRVSSSRATPSNKPREGRVQSREAVPGVKSKKGKSDKASLRKEMSSWQ